MDSKRQCGKIKWFGGTNRNGKKLNYGFILDLESGEDLYVNESEVLCGTYKLSSDIYVTYVIDMTMKDKIKR